MVEKSTVNIPLSILSKGRGCSFAEKSSVRGGKKKEAKYRGKITFPNGRPNRESLDKNFLRLSRSFLIKGSKINTGNFLPLRAIDTFSLGRSTTNLRPIF